MSANCNFEQHCEQIVEYSCAPSTHSLAQQVHHHHFQTLSSLVLESILASVSTLTAFLVAGSFLLLNATHE